MSEHPEWEAKMVPGVWAESVNVELEKQCANGWELVTVLPGKEGRRELYFKRSYREPEEAADEKKPAADSMKFKFAEDMKKAFQEGLKGKD